MHYRMFVTFNKDHAEDSEQAREYAESTLLDDSSFIGEGGRFGSSICDWFQIGGRWSGELSELTWGKKFYKEAEKMQKKASVEIRGVHYGSADIENNKKQAELKRKVEKLYQKALPEELKDKGLVYDRHQHVQDHYFDDAMVVTPQIYNKVLAKNEGEDQSDGEWGLNFCDLDWDCVSKDFINKKWIVVVDYHC